jgi:hypothetical protein
MLKMYAYMQQFRIYYWRNTMKPMLDDYNLCQDQKWRASKTVRESVEQSDKLLNSLVPDGTGIVNAGVMLFSETKTNCQIILGAEKRATLPGTKQGDLNVCMGRVKKGDTPTITAFKELVEETRGNVEITLQEVCNAIKEKHFGVTFHKNHEASIIVFIRTKGISAEYLNEHNSDETSVIGKEKSQLLKDRDEKERWSEVNFKYFFEKCKTLSDDYPHKTGKTINEKTVASYGLQLPVSFITRTALQQSFMKPLGAFAQEIDFSETTQDFQDLTVGLVGEQQEHPSS